MNTSPSDATQDSADHLIAEVREARRELCRQFGGDLDRIACHLAEIEADYVARRGSYAGISGEAAERVVQGWGAAPHSTDDALINDVRAARRDATGGPAQRGAP